MPAANVTIRHYLLAIGVFCSPAKSAGL
uniref:Uncharacterized protein H1.10 n=1 Tax=Gallus gallus TaxID=9031 RepID=Q7LZ17_CHICK|nr:histone H1 [Gallus gallus]